MKTATIDRYTLLPFTKSEPANHKYVRSGVALLGITLFVVGFLALLASQNAFTSALGNMGAGGASALFILGLLTLVILYKVKKEYKIGSFFQQPAPESGTVRFSPLEIASFQRAITKSDASSSATANAPKSVAAPVDPSQPLPSVQFASSKTTVLPSAKELGVASSHSASAVAPKPIAPVVDPSLPVPSIELVSLKALLALEERNDAETMARYNREESVTIIGRLNDIEDVKAQLIANFGEVPEISLGCLTISQNGVSRPLATFFEQSVKYLIFPSDRFLEVPLSKIAQLSLVTRQVTDALCLRFHKTPHQAPKIRGMPLTISDISSFSGKEIYDNIAAQKWSFSLVACLSPLQFQEYMREADRNGNKAVFEYDFRFIGHYMDQHVKKLYKSLDKALFDKLPQAIKLEVELQH